jgi:hypothetical protein
MRFIALLLILFMPSIAGAVTTTPFNLTSGYAVYYLDGSAGTAPKLDNAEGTAARDLTQNGSPASVTGYTTPTTDGAYDFTNTANQNLALNDPADFPTGAMSIEMWVNPDVGAPADTEGVMTKYNGGTDNTFYIARSGEDTWIAGFFNAADAETATGSFTVNDSGWHYVVLTFEPSVALRAYVDGVNVASDLTSVAASLKDSAAKFMIGNYDQVEGTAANNFDGKIDSVKISNVTLTGTQISDYYNDVVAGGAAPLPPGAIQIE